MRSIQVAVAAALTLILSGQAVALPDFRLPSYVTLQAGGSNQDSRNGSIQAAFTLPNNWQIGAAHETGTSANADTGDTVRIRASGIDLATDPLADFSAQFRGETLVIGDNVSANGGRAGIAWAAGRWIFGAHAGRQRYEFKELPRLIWSDRVSYVHDDSFGGSVDFFATRRWSFRLSFTQHRFDQNLKDYTEGLRVNFISNEVLMTSSGFAQSEGKIEASFTHRPVSLTLVLGSSRSALDGVRTRQVGLGASYRFSRAWSTFITLNRYRPESSQEDDRATAAAGAGVTFAW